MYYTFPSFIITNPHPLHQMDHSLNAPPRYSVVAHASNGSLTDQGYIVVKRGDRLLALPKRVSPVVSIALLKSFMVLLPGLH